MNDKQCPFCGSQTLSVEYLVPAWGGSSNEKKEAHIVCDECASSSPIYIWNNRHQMTSRTQINSNNVNKS